MEIHFERQALYDEVWFTPLTTLGKKYGLSGNGLRKVCIAMSIPLPRAGHWTKVEARQVVDRTELPLEAERTHFICTPPPKPLSEFSQPEEAAWLQEKLRFESLPENQIQVVLSPSKWHTAVVTVRQELKKAAKDYADFLQRMEILKNTPPSTSSWEPGLAGVSRYSFSGEMLAPSQGKFCVRCTTATYERALAIANSLMYEGRKRGCKVGFDTREQRFFLELQPAHFGFSIRDRRGKLAVVIERRYGSNFEIVDGNLPVEKQLGVVFQKLYRHVVTSRDYERKADVDRKEAAIASMEKAERLAQQELEAAAKAEEVEKRRTLEADAAASERAQMIRRYVDRVLMGQHAEYEQAALWVTWARQVADAIDPVPGLRQRLFQGG